MNVEASKTCGAMPMTMHPESFSAYSLKKMYVWEPDTSNIVVQVANHYEFPPALLPYTPQVLKSLMSDRGDGIAADTWDHDCNAERVIQQLLADQMVEGSPWKLTLLGRESIECGVRCLSCKPVLTHPAENADLNEASLAELICLLEYKHWQLVPDVSKASAAALKDTPFIVDAEPMQEKKWYHRAGKSVSRFYLMALLSAHAGRPVPHFQDDDVYLGLLGIEKPGRKRLRCKVQQMQYIGDCEWPEDALPLEDVAKKRARRQKRVCRKALLQAPANDGSDEHEDADVDENDSLSSDSSSLSSDSSSSSSSSSSNSKSAADGGEEDMAHDGDDRDDLPPLPPPPLPPPEEIRDLSSNRRFGFSALTIYVVSTKHGTTGWQLTCNHPEHITGPKCTKSQTNSADGGEDGTLRRLKYWAILGVRCPTKAAHKDMWATVQEAWTNGTVPSMAELDDGRMPLTV